MFNITAPHGSIMGFLKSGELIMEVKVDDASKLVVCKPYTRCSDHFTDLEFSRTSDMMSVNSYVETLLFLGRSFKVLLVALRRSRSDWRKETTMHTTREVSW
ncbi:unnamed protein product [Lactuca virosa]|uniref:Uncharacterized protein n=1 Tax=Lactuca virosa TaxID=75947 RepID=A0AAU9MNK1_9ASTR|nr:unnamed protein product [Lactuca virosa]